MREIYCDKNLNAQDSVVWALLSSFVRYWMKEFHLDPIKANANDCDFSIQSQQNIDASCEGNPAFSEQSKQSCLPSLHLH
jgi:hypothetical protein